MSEQLAQTYSPVTNMYFDIWNRHLLMKNVQDNTSITFLLSNYKPHVIYSVLHTFRMFIEIATVRGMSRKQRRSTVIASKARGK